MSTHPSTAAGLFEPQSGLNKNLSEQNPTSSGDGIVPSTLSRPVPRSRAKQQTRVGVEFTTTVSRPSRLSRAIEDPVLNQEVQKMDEEHVGERTPPLNELINTECQFSRTLQFIINVAIPLAQGYPPQPIADVATRVAYLPQEKKDPPQEKKGSPQGTKGSPQGEKDRASPPAPVLSKDEGKKGPADPPAPVLSKGDVNLVFGPAPYELYEGSRHITNKLRDEVLKNGYEKARVGKFLVFAVSQ